MQQLPYWGYPIMFLLMVTEGTVITVVSAFLASLGFFDIFIVFLLSLIGDIVSDIVIYFIGYFGGRRCLNFVDRKFRYNGSVVVKMEKAFREKGAKIIFFVKSTTGLCFVTFILAGASKMKFRKFLMFSFLGGIFWSLLLVILGYFFGYAAEQISQYVKYAGFIVFGIAVLTVILLILIGKWQAKKFIRKQS